MKESLLYKILRPLICAYTRIFLRPKYLGLENIPKEGKVILAGTHTHMCDSILLISCTKRHIHFLAKKELWNFPSSIIMSHMGLIPVDRKNKSKESLFLAKKYLDDEKMVLIFPEGTIEKVEGELLPFKLGAVKLAFDTGSPIIPFSISGKYYSKKLRIKFGKAIYVSSDLSSEIKNLEKQIIKLKE